MRRPLASTPLARRSVAGLLGAALLLPAVAAAQSQQIRYDNIRQDSDAAITCGFCAGEKFGVIFRTGANQGGIPQGAIPFTLNAVQIAVASTIVDDSLTCQPSNMGGMVNGTMEIYAGMAPPTSITTLPAAGPWPGESTIVAGTQVQLERSIEATMGSGQWDVRLNSLPINQPVGAPNTYVRVVFTIGAGGMSASCQLLGFQPPNISPFRDNNDVVPRTSFIYQLGIQGINDPQWTFNEDFRDPSTGQHIRGDWLIRLEATPFGGPQPDAGVMPPPPDAGFPDSGVAPADAGFPEADAGFPPVDAGVALGAPTISAISPAMTAQGTAVDVTIIGTNFAPDVAVRVGQIFLNVERVGGTSTIEAQVPAGIAAGTYDVVIRNPDGQSAILTSGFTVTGAPVGGTPAPADTGCGCATTREADAGSALAGLLLALGLVLRRRR